MPCYISLSNSQAVALIAVTSKIFYCSNDEKNGQDSVLSGPLRVLVWLDRLYLYIVSEKFKLEQRNWFILYLVFECVT